MITLHYLSNSHSHVVLWLLEELGLDCTLVKHQRTPQGRSPETLAAVHPLAKAPTIEDHGITMVESTGIILYILETYGEGKLRPAPNTADAMRFFQWLTYIEGSAKAPIGTKFAILGSGVQDDKLNAMSAQNLQKPLSFINDSLEGQDYLIKDSFTAADIQLGFYSALIEAVQEIGAYANIQAHLERMRARKAYQVAEEKGGPVGLTSLFKGLSLGKSG